MGTSWKIMNSDSVEYLVFCFAAVIVHEMAHVLVATAMGIRVKRV